MCVCVCINMLYLYIYICMYVCIFRVNPLHGPAHPLQGTEGRGEM